jgi:tetratricopeptide (TPR) repeat protein
VRNRDWRDELSLWTSASRVSPRSFKVYKSLARAVADADPSEAGLDDAIALAERAVAVLEDPPLPDDRMDDNVLVDVAVLYSLKGDAIARRGDLATADGWHRRSVAVLERARALDALQNRRARERALARGLTEDQVFDVGNRSIYRTLATGYVRIGEPAKAKEALEHARRLEPTVAEVHLLLGILAQQQGEPHEAVVAFVQALLVDPGNAEAAIRLRAAYAELAPDVAPLVDTPSGPALDLGQPLVRHHVTSACLRLHRLLRESHRWRDAAEFRRLAVSGYDVPPSLLPEGPPPARP